MKKVRLYHKQFTLDTAETKLLNEFFNRFFDLTGMTKIEVYEDDEDGNKVIVEIQGKIEE